MKAQGTGSLKTILADLDQLLPDLEALYKDLHAHPELSMSETRTAGLAADRLRKAGFDVATGVGKTEIARSLAQLVGAPFLKVEATKYTEVGYHGPDVESNIRAVLEVNVCVAGFHS